MFEFTLKIDPAVAELLGLDGDSIIEAFYPPCNGCPLFCQEHGICLAKTILE